MKPWLPSPGRMAIPPGSSMRALRVGSGRGPTFRTAPRGAGSGRMKHATGFTCLSRSDHQDLREPEPWLRRPSPLICRSNPPVGRRCDTGSQYVSDEVRDNKIGTRANHASARIYSGYRVLRWKRCGNLTHFWHAAYRLHQHNVDMCIHIGIRRSSRPGAGAGRQAGSL